MGNCHTRRLPSGGCSWRGVPEALWPAKCSTKTYYKDEEERSTLYPALATVGFGEFGKVVVCDDFVALLCPSRPGSNVQTMGI